MLALCIWLSTDLWLRHIQCMLRRLVAFSHWLGLTLPSLPPVNHRRAFGLALGEL